MAKIAKKKEVVVENNTAPLKAVEIGGDLIVGFTPCQKCGKPSTLRSNKGHVFCDLACQVAFGD
jgi:hypothetical protein